MQGRIFIEGLLPILLTTPVMIIFIKDKSYFKTLGLILIIYISHQVIGRFPMQYTQLQITSGRWNWTGKLLGIVFDALVYIAMRKKMSPYDFIKIGQAQQYFQKTMIATVLITCTAFFSYFDSSLTMDRETLLYQLTMPGLDEEIMFRAILLGLLLTCLKENIKIGQFNFGSPSILIIGLLFGLLHGLTLTDNFSFKFDYLYFLSTFIFGYIWSWITVKSKSILQPVISHSLFNFVAYLIRMTK
jgi:predicted Abi (CAAX) family protease